jgi:hypothetical protein
MVPVNVDIAYLKQVVVLFCLEFDWALSIMNLILLIDNIWHVHSISMEMLCIYFHFEAMQLLSFCEQIQYNIQYLAKM